MLRAVKSFMATVDREVIEVEKGQTYVIEGHPLARIRPDAFEVEEPRTVDVDALVEHARNRSHPRPASEPPRWKPEPRDSLEEELRVRDRAIASLQREAAASADRRRRPDPEERFWSNVGHLLGHDRFEAKDREAMRQLDELEQLRAAAIRDETEELSAWLTR